MTAKEKARDIFNQHLKIHIDSYFSSTTVFHSDVKKCALVTVEELLKMVHLDVDPKDMKEYWTEVKQEIELIPNKN